MAGCAVNLGLWVIAGTMAGWMGWLALAAAVAVFIDMAGIIFFMTLFVGFHRPAGRASQAQRPAGGGAQPHPLYAAPTHQSEYGRACLQHQQQAALPPSEPPAHPPEAPYMLLWAFRDENRCRGN
jgi:hypothetical protein